MVSLDGVSVGSALWCARLASAEHDPPGESSDISSLAWFESLFHFPDLQVCIMRMALGMATLFGGHIRSFTLLGR